MAFFLIKSIFLIIIKPI